MAGQSSAMFGWSWTEVSVLGSQVFGRALMESCEGVELVGEGSVVNWATLSSLWMGGHRERAAAYYPKISKIIRE